MKKISIYCFILISLGFIGCTSKTHEKTIEDFDIREMSLQVDTLYSRMDTSRKSCTIVWYSSERNNGGWKTVIRKV